MKKLRVGIIGAGFGVRVHRPAFERLRSCEITATGSSARWKKIVCDPRVDALSVAVVPRAQAAILAACARERKHIFFEKPLCADWKQAAALRRIFASGGKTTMVDFELAELESWKKFRRILLDGGLGRLRHAVIDWHLETYANKFHLDSWKTKIRPGGGALGAFGSHAFYHLEWLFGRAGKVSAHLFRFAGSAGDAETAFSCVFQMARGFPVFINVSTHSASGGGHRILAEGDKGALRLENKTADYVRGFRLFSADRRRNGWRRIRVPEMTLDSRDARISAVGCMAGRFTAAALAGKKIKPGFPEALRAQWLMERARHSSKIKKWVNCG